MGPGAGQMSQAATATQPCDRFSTVGMPPEQVADIESAMRDFVTIVSYDCKQLTLLKDCRLEGAYGFLDGAPPREVTRVSQRQGGETFTLAMVRAGEKRTTWERVGRADMRGICNGATHVIRGASYGAFEMTKDASSASHSRVKTATAGDVEECAAIEPNARRRQPVCLGLLELFLLPVVP